MGQAALAGRAWKAALNRLDDPRRAVRDDEQRIAQTPRPHVLEEGRDRLAILLAASHEVQQHLAAVGAVAPGRQHRLAPLTRTVRVNRSYSCTAVPPHIRGLLARNSGGSRGRSASNAHCELARREIRALTAERRADSHPPSALCEGRPPQRRAVCREPYFGFESHQIFFLYQGLAGGAGSLERTRLCGISLICRESTGNISESGLFRASRPPLNC